MLAARRLAGLARTPALRFARPQLMSPMASLPSRNFLTWSPPLQDEETKKTQAAFRADDPEHPEQIAAREALAKGDTRHAFGLHKDAGAIGQAGIFEKYGVVPVIGLGLAALVSKEVLFLDEGLLLAGTFSTLIFAGYVNFGESVTKGFEADVAEQRAEFENAIDGVIDAGDKALDTFKLGATLVDDTQALISAYNEAAAKHRATRDMALKQSVKEDLEFWMQTLADKERNFFDKLSLKLAHDSYEAVLEDLKQSDETQQDAGIRNVLSRINGIEDSSTDDVVLTLYRKHYNRFFEEFDKKKDASKLTKAEIAAAQEDLDRWAQMWQDRTGQAVEVKTATTAKSVW